jgi:hypothetical protein
MKNSDDILKKILLHMNYDSKKTLSENKRSFILEEKVPINAKLTDFENGKSRSLEYPELGKWGDGRCKCVDIKDELKYETSCCKKGTLSSTGTEYLGVAPEGGTTEGQQEIKGIDYDGNELMLPIGTTNVKTYNFFDETWIPIRTNAKNAISRFPRLEEYCKLSKESESGTYGSKAEFTSIDKCVTDGAQRLLELLKNKSITNFTYGGRNYNLCYTKIAENPLDFKFTGYYGITPGEKVDVEQNVCQGVPWEGIKKDEDEKKSSTSKSKTQVTGYEDNPDYTGGVDYDISGNEILLPLNK